MGVPDSRLTQSQIYRPIPDVGRAEAIEEGLGQRQPPRGGLGIATIKPQEFKFGNYKTLGPSCPCTAFILMLADTARWVSLLPFTEAEAEPQRHEATSPRSAQLVEEGWALVPSHSGLLQRK